MNSTLQMIGQLALICNMVDIYYLARAERDLEHYQAANYQLDLADLCDQTDQVSDQMNSALREAFQMERCASGYYSQRIKEGHQACQELIGHRYYGELAFKNLPWYFAKRSETDKNDLNN